MNETQKKLATEIELLEESELRQQLFQVTLELWRYQDIVQAIYDYLETIKFEKKVCFELYEIIKKLEIE